MSLQYICDCCDRTPAVYDIEQKVRVKTRIFGWEGESWSKTFRICEDCWKEIGKRVGGKR